MDNRPHVIDGKTVDPKRAVPREEGQKGTDGNVSSKRLYVANVKEISEEQLREYFSKYGGIEKVLSYNSRFSAIGTTFLG